MSDQYGTIIVSGGYGIKRGCIVDGTPKPGTCMTVKAATEPVNGRHTYEAYNRDGDGNRAEVAILLEDKNQGKTVDDAYVSGTHGQLYFPQAGDLLQMLLQNQGGTGDSFAIGDYLMIDDGTGKLIASSSPENEPFVVMETQAALTADTLVLCLFTGQ